MFALVLCVVFLQLRRTRSNASDVEQPSAQAARPWFHGDPNKPDEIERAAKLYNITSALVRAIIAAESAGDASAISSSGRVGLMGLTPFVAQEMFVKDIADPAQNIYGGTRYLRYCANEFGGDMLLALAAYRAGPQSVRKYRGIPPSDETPQYVRKVMAHYYELKREESGEAKGQTRAADPAQTTDKSAESFPQAGADQNADTTGDEPPAQVRGPALGWATDDATDSEPLSTTPGRRFHGHECTIDCSGHQAGYEWAEKHSIDNPDDCDVAGETSNSPSFAEGCLAHVNGESSSDAEESE
jgi:hypothetical protein